MLRGEITFSVYLLAYIETIRTCASQNIILASYDTI